MRSRFLVPLFVLAVTTPGFAGFPVPEPLCPPEPGLYLCGRTASAPVIDGRLDDAAWLDAAWTADFVDIEGDAKPRPAWATNVKMCWDEAGFYVAARLVEPHVWGSLTERDAVIYHDNDFEVFLDPDGDNHLYYELEINALGTEWDLLLVKPYRDGAPAVNAWDIQGLRTAVHVDGSLNDPGDEDRGWNVEIAFPWEVLAQCAGRTTPPAEGDIWRVNFSRVQWQADAVDGRYVKRTDPVTGDALPENNWVWSPQGLIAMHYPERWGEVMFTGGSGRADPSGRFGRSAEHALIAAGNRLMTLYYAQRQRHEEQGAYAVSLEELDVACAWPAGTKLTLGGDGRRFLIQAVTPHGRVTVDETGRLVRIPREGKR